MTFWCTPPRRHAFQLPMSKDPWTETNEKGIRANPGLLASHSNSFRHGFFDLWGLPLCSNDKSSSGPRAYAVRWLPKNQISHDPDSFYLITSCIDHGFCCVLRIDHCSTTPISLSRGCLVRVPDDPSYCVPPLLWARHRHHEGEAGCKHHPTTLRDRTVAAGGPFFFPFPFFILALSSLVFLVVICLISRKVPVRPPSQV